ncbi:MAG: oxidoreductase [Acidobacteria bacterium]|nr:MAG: oxidoreductase [Acidobacteriota bacterium]
MLALLTDRKSGEVSTYDVPAPELRPGGLLVRTQYSAISAGTERATLELSSKSLLAKARARPDLVKQVIEYARQNGVRAAYEKVHAKLDTLATLGYSCAGEVISVGDGVHEFRAGDRVACGGGSYANHAEINFVPRNLAVHIPSQVSTAAASLTTIGAIALQGFRQADVGIGETVAVIGAGLVGVLTIQIARAAGCRVVAIDLSPQRVERAVEFGAHLAVAANDPALVSSIKEFSRYGVDAAILTAATDSVEPAEMAAKILRDRGRIIVVGAVGMGVSRSNMYMKELSLTLSRSYGPGRYDPQYEEGGFDYPIGYVRWTERRNMESFLDLLATGRIDVTPLLQHHYAIDEGAKAYSDLKNGLYTAILEYNGASAVSQRTVSAVAAARPRIGDEVRVGCIGAGSFASSVIFPNLQSIKGVRLQCVGTISGAGAASAQRAFRFQTAEQPSELLNDPNVDTVFILTRHDTHASLAVRALHSGKPVFVEKPLAIDREQLAQIQEVYAAQLQAGRAPFVMVGFNRRFAPFTEKIRQFFAERREPMLVHARVNAGYIPRDHWVHAQGGRIVGEFCHFVDWARFVIGSPIHSVAAAGLPDGAQYTSDNIAVTLKFADGSVANLLYLANGDRSIPKEFFEVFCQGAIARLHDFRTLELARNGKVRKFKSVQDKGHRRELQLTIEALRAGRSSPISFDELVEVTGATFLVQHALAAGEVFRLVQAAPAAPLPEMPDAVQRHSADTGDCACA